MKKKIIIRPEGPAKKIILLRFCPKKIFWPGQKTQAPPPGISNGQCLKAHCNNSNKSCIRNEWIDLTFARYSCVLQENSSVFFILKPDAVPEKNPEKKNK